MFSYSKVDTHSQCPYKYKLRYKDKLEVLPDQRPENALYLGTACHEGIEKRSIDAAIESYKSNYTTWTEENDLEAHKLRCALKTAIKTIPEGEYEKKLLADDGFIGFIDELVKNDDGTYTMFDFKYSNREDTYRRSKQLHVYHYYFEKLTGNKIKDMYYILIPKATRTLKESIEEELADKQPNYLKIEFDPKQVNYFFANKALMDKSDKNCTYDKCYSTSCKWCDYARFCKSNGADTSELTEAAKEKLIKQANTKAHTNEVNYKEVALF